MTALFAFVEDLLAEGVDTVLGRARGYGADELALAFSYHAARDVTPHGPSRVVWRRSGLRFVPRPDAFVAAGVNPAVVTGTMDASALVAQSRAAGLEPLGWSVFCHNEELGRAHPELAHENCFGDKAAPADLCPAAPRIRAYCVALARAVASLGVGTVVAESLHYGAFGHGYHHERSFVELGSAEALLLGLCFCPSCSAAADNAGVDSAEARRTACQLLTERFDGVRAATDVVTIDELAAIAPGLAAFARVRTQTVTSLTAEVAEAVRAEGARLVFLDLTGATQGYADGRPGEASGLDEAWKYGIDPQGISRFADYGILAYAREVARVRAETERYRGALAEGARLRVLLRPGLPDCEDESNLRQKVRTARRAGADSIDFYHYGLAPLTDLERIPFALAESE